MDVQSTKQFTDASAVTATFGEAEQIEKARRLSDIMAQIVQAGMEIKAAQDVLMVLAAERDDLAVYFHSLRYGDARKKTNPRLKFLVTEDKNGLDTALPNDK